MPRIGFVGPSYTASSTAIADEECINFYPETLESQSGQVASQAYGAASGQPVRSLLPTPGLKVFATLPMSPVRGQCWTGKRWFVVGGSNLVELATDATPTPRGVIANDSKAVSMAVSAIQMLIVSAGKAYCYTFATDVLTEVTTQLAGVPVQVEYSDGYFVVLLQGNKYQISQILDGTTWPGLLVNEVSVFPEDITSIIVNHRELWVFGQQHAQPYGDTGSDNVFDVIPGVLIETGSIATFGPCRLDNSVFWIDENERGGRSAWRAQAYSPQRISTHAVEVALNSYANIADLVSYSYQDAGHIFWVLYVPGADCTWVYDVTSGMWHKRAAWDGVAFNPHASWNHVSVSGKHYVGDWNSANIYEMSSAYLDDNGATIRRVRRTPTVISEMERVFHAELTVDLQTGIGPQPPLLDGNGNPRAPQAILRWSDNRGKTWSNDHFLGCGLAGEYNVRVIWRRLGNARYRVYEFVVTDPVAWVIVDAYLRTS